MLTECGEGLKFKMCEAGKNLPAIEASSRPQTPTTISVYFSLSTFPPMVYVTYNIPEMGLSTLVSVRRLFLRVVYITDKLFLIPDYSVICFEA